MSATATRTTPMTWPRLETCGTCQELVLLARHEGAGRPVRLDPVEALPLGPCSGCRGTGNAVASVQIGGGTAGGGPRRSVEPGDLYGVTRRQQVGASPLCDGTGQRGEQVGPDHVLVSVDGVARPNTGERRTWEAAHRRHVCG